MVRVKRRYIVAKIVGQRKKDSFQDQEILNEVCNQVATCYGDFGVGCLKRNFNIKRHDILGGFVIIQVRKGVHELVMSAMTLISKIANKPCQVNIVHLSGTLRSSLKHLRLHYLTDLRAKISQRMQSEVGNQSKIANKMQ